MIPLPIYLYGSPEWAAAALTCWATALLFAFWRHQNSVALSTKARLGELSETDREWAEMTLNALTITSRVFVLIALWLTAYWVQTSVGEYAAAVRVSAVRGMAMQSDLSIAIDVLSLVGGACSFIIGMITLISNLINNQKP